MKNQPLMSVSLASRLVRWAGVAFLLSGCTVEHMEVGIDQGGIGGQSPSNEPSECPQDCPVEDICFQCDDNSCATPNVQCKADGSCGKVEWECADGEPPPADCDCEVPAICQRCDDDTCAVPNVECKPDGSCGEIDWTCPGGSGSPSNSGSDPTTPACPDPKTLCEAQCDGKVLDVAPDCPVSDSDCDCEPDPARTTCDCAVPEICKICDDGSCAEAKVSCDADGQCGEILWVCADPAPPSCECAVDLICHLCDDGTCAEPNVACNDDGSCGDTTWTCPNTPDKYDCDTSGALCDLAVNCEDGKVPTRNGDCYGPCVDPEQCITVQKYDCDISKVLCESEVPDCGPDLVPTHQDYCYGDCVSPSLCAPTEGSTCPEMCPVLAICQVCEDGSCAIPNVACNDDGSCGKTTWTCPNE